MNFFFHLINVHLALVLGNKTCFVVRTTTVLVVQKYERISNQRDQFCSKLSFDLCQVSENAIHMF